MKILTYLITSFRAHHLIRLAIICLDHENCRYSKYIFQQYTYIVTCIYVSIREITTIPFLIMDLLQMLLLYMYLFKYFISTFISLSSNQNWKCSLRKKEETPHTVSEHFQAVWNTERLIHFISKHFVKKKRKSADQRITFISVQYSHCQNMKIWKGFDFFLRHDFIINVGHIIKKISTCLNLYFNKFFIVIYHWFFFPQSL